MDEELKVSDSILSSVKKLIGIQPEDESFDLDIIFHINAAFSTLFQIGVFKKPYMITSKNNIYSELSFGNKMDVLSLIRIYLYYKVKLGFDSSTLSANVISSLEKLIDETEWRLYVAFNDEDTFDYGGEIQNERLIL